MSLRKRGGDAVPTEEGEVARECGMVVALKDTFGFLRPPAASLQAAKKVEDVFFHFDSLASSKHAAAEVRIGDEFSYVVQNKSNGKRASAVGLVRLVPNEMFRIFSAKHQLAERVGQVVSVDSNSGTFLECMYKGVLERVFCIPADFPCVKVGQYCLFKLCVYPLEHNFVAVGPVTLFSSQPMAAKILPNNKAQMEGLMNKQVSYVTMLPSALQIGDGVWVQTNTEQTIAVVTSLFLPQGESREEDNTLLAWLENKEEEEEEEQKVRQTGVVVTVKDEQFAFATMTAAATGNKEQVYINWNELCALPPPLSPTASSIQVGDLVSFQVRKRKEGGSNSVAIRVFNQSRFGKKRSSSNNAAASKNQRIVFQTDNTGVVQFKGNRAFVDFTQVKPENQAIWQRLVETTDSGLIPIDGGDAKRVKDGQQVCFDLVVVRKPKDKLHCLATLQRPKLRTAATQGEEVGFVSHAGSICSAWRPQHKITFNSKEYPNVKPGDFVQFKTTSNGGEELQATAVQVTSVPSTDLLGLVPLQQTRIRGVCTKFSGGSGVMDASVLRASYTNGPGRILVGKPFEFDDVEASKREEEEPADWRKLAELQRSVKILCATSHHAFTLSSTAEVLAVEKECKRLGLLSIKYGASMIACGKDKSVLDLWAKRLGKTVRFGNALGRIVECQFTPNDDRMVLEVELEDGFRTALLDKDDDTLQYVDSASTRGGEGENMQSALRDWVTYVKPSSLPDGAAVCVDDEDTLQLPMSAMQVYLDECLYFTEQQDGMLAVSRSTTPCVRPPPSVAQYGFSSTNDVFPVEGDEVDFIPCVSAITGRLRAWDVRIVTPKQTQRTEGVVEELRSGGAGGGWIRPAGLTSVKFEGTDVLSKPLTLGDSVDFYLTKDRAHRVRFLKHGTLPHIAAGISLTVPSSVSNTPSRFKSSSTSTEQDENLNKIAMPANYLTAVGPDEDYAVGFTPEKWRFKRQVKIRATAAEFIPQSFTPPHQ